MRYVLIEVYENGKQLRADETDDLEEAKQWAEESDDRELVETNVFDTETNKVVYTYEYEFEEEQISHEGEDGWIEIREVVMYKK